MPSRSSSRTSRRSTKTTSSRPWRARASARLRVRMRAFAPSTISRKPFLSFTPALPAPRSVGVPPRPAAASSGNSRRREYRRCSPRAFRWPAWHRGPGREAGAPPLARGRRHRLLLPVAAGAGAMFLVLADALPRRRAGGPQHHQGPAMPRAELVALQPETANAALWVAPARRGAVGSLRAPAASGRLAAGCERVTQPSHVRATRRQAPQRFVGTSWNGTSRRTGAAGRGSARASTSR